MGSVNAGPQSHLQPHDRAEIVEFDRRFREHAWRWVGTLLGGAVAFGALLKMMSPSLAWGDVLLVSAAACVGFIFVVIPVWFSYRTFAANPWKWVGYLVALSLLSCVAVLMVLTIGSGKTLSDMPLEKGLRAVAFAVTTGLSIGMVIVVITRVRLREAAQREARLAAEAESERLARQTAQAELRILQAQIEPHFLFNTLANLRHLVQSGSGDALPMLDHLIHYLRTALADIRSDSTTLGREGDLARAYLEIMRMRMGALTFGIGIPAEIAAHAFPPLLLMTLVENAVKHGVGPKGGGEIRIVALREGERILVDVVDDGRGLAGEIGQGLGLANVRERLRTLYGDAARLSMESVETGGTRARLEIPA
jgi:sensor histidine kinase YesM